MSLSFDVEFEEEKLESMGPQEEAAAIREANAQAIRRMEIEEALHLKKLQRFSSAESWLQLCRLVGGNEEKRGVEELLRDPFGGGLHRGPGRGEGPCGGVESCHPQRSSSPV